MYTIETETELHNWLVPWGIIATCACSGRVYKANSSSWAHMISVLQKELWKVAEVELLETSRSNWTSLTVSSEMEPVRTTRSYLDRLTPLPTKQEWTSSNCLLEDVLDNPSVLNNRAVWLNSTPLHHRAPPHAHAPPRARACLWSKCKNSSWSFWTFQNTGRPSQKQNNIIVFFTVQQRCKHLSCLLFSWAYHLSLLYTYVCLLYTYICLLYIYWL